jgi:hypothetical protein
MSIGHVLGLFKSFISFPIIGVTLNPADKSSLVILSNGNMTANRNTGTSWVSVRATQSRLFGKYYFEVVFNSFTGSYGCAGLMGISSTLGAYPGFDTTGFGWVTDGSWFNAGVSTFGALPTSWANGDVLCIAVDFTNKKLWARKNNETWNATSGGSNDPASNVGGISFPAAIQNLFLYPAVGVQISTDTSTARFTQSSFGYTVPSGFSAWESEGQLYVTQQRAYTVLGAPAGVAVSQQRAYTVLGAVPGVAVNQQRAYAVMGAVPGVSIGQQRAYTIIGAVKDGLSINRQIGYVPIGMPPPGNLVVNQHTAYAVVGTPLPGNLAVHTHLTYVILTP